MSSRGEGRKLFGAPILLQDWDKEAEEAAAQYWELFLDLLLVAAASSVADQFKEDEDFASFVLYFLILVNGWTLYSLHITSRIEDSSLAHSLVLFVYFFGFGLSIVNVGDPAQFAVGALVLRVTILVMLASFAHCLPRTRYFCTALGTVTVVPLGGLLVALLAPSEKMAVAGLWMAALTESFSEIFLACCIDNRKFIPLNIDQAKERLGALELIMLGETALSVTITYRELDKEDIIGDSKSRYYWVLGLSFLLIFMFCLLYFHVQPPPSDHAFRRSLFHGMSFLWIHKILGLALLAVGTSIKLVVEHVMMQEEPTTLFLYHLMGWGVGTSLLILLGIRLLHYWGRDEIHFGEQTLIFSEHPDLARLGKIWWSTMAAAVPLPFIGVATGVTTHDPFMSVALHALLLFALCCLESYYTHTISDTLAARAPLEEGERKPLLVTEQQAKLAV